MASTEYVVEENDTAGGAGANFIVEWSASAEVTSPVVEAVMIGTVSQQGAVRVRIMVGENAAQATGRLGGNSGSGTWHGAGINEACSGTWQAERR